MRGGVGVTRVGDADAGRASLGVATEPHREPRSSGSQLERPAVRAASSAAAANGELRPPAPEP